MDLTDRRSSVIRVRGLDVRYPSAHALKGLDLSIASGSFVLIGGRSGSGKSTLAQALLGLLSHDELGISSEVTGQISVAGLIPGREPVAQLATRTGLVFQNPATQLFNGTVEDEVAFGPRNLALTWKEIDDRVAYALKATGCEHLRKRSVRHLSGGEQQRVAIAANLAMRPSILILDEPTANLDEDGTHSVVRALVRLQREFGMTIVVIEHRLDPFLGCAERLIWLEEGRVVADGLPHEVLPRVQAVRLSWTPPSSNGGNPLVSLDRVTAGYDGRLVLQDCSLTLREGQLGALVGPNGAGKSTVARVLAGLLRPRRGRVVWHTGGRVACRVGFLQQNPLHQLVCSTVEEEVRFGPRNLGVERDDEIEGVLASMGLDGLRYRSTQALSVGEQQRTALAATLSTHPELLIVDEPTLGQDREHLQKMMGLVRELNEQGQTVLLISHNKELVAGCANHIWEVGGTGIRERRGV
jgi:energy-coupling factor transport system ATP-binding protein